MPTIGDSAIPHKLGCRTIWSNWLQDYIGAAPNAGLGAGLPPMAEIVAAAELAGRKLDDDDEMYGMLDVHDLFDCDWSKDLQVEVLYFVAGSDGDDGPTFQVDAKFVKAGNAQLAATQGGDAFGDCKVSPDAQATITTDSIETAANLMRSGRFALPTGGDLQVDGDGMPTDDIMQFAVTLTELGDDVQNGETFVLGVRFYYTRQIAHPSGHSRRTG